ncbi:MAG: amphi-Trp domain-containing protein [Polyangiaceae bacterium]
MSSNDDEFRHDSLQDQQSIAKYLEVLVQGLQSGKLTFESDAKRIALEPQGLIELEVRVKRAHGRAKVRFRLMWREERKPSKPIKDKLTVRAD